MERTENVSEKFVFVFVAIFVQIFFVIVNFIHKFFAENEQKKNAAANINNLPSFFDGGCVLARKYT